MARKRDALHILNERVGRDPELQELVKKERVNFQVAVAIREAREGAGKAVGGIYPNQLS